MRTTEGRMYQLTDPVDTGYTIVNVELRGWPSNVVMPFTEWLDKSNSGVFMREIVRAEVLGNQDKKQFWTFAKMWSIWDADSQVWYPTKVGLGAYGDTAGWRRNVIANGRVVA